MNHRVMLLIVKNLCFSLTQFLETIYNHSTTQNVPNLDNVFGLLSS